MRKRFEQQPFLDYVDIKDIDFGHPRNRSRLAQLYRTLQEIFITSEYNEKLFDILEKSITKGKKKTGRQGMDLWIIFLLAQTRLCMNIDYETLLHMANYDYLLRQLMGIETYTEWITKGKLSPSVELGKKLLITTDQNNLIVDYLVMDNLSDSESVEELTKRISVKYKKIETWSFDKGFYSKANKALLLPFVQNLIMPKKGKRNSLEKEQEPLKEFKKWKGKHSAVESNINELEHCGLGRCPDKGYDHFKRYIGLGVTAYNLRRIGKVLIDQDYQLKLKSA